MRSDRYGPVVLLAVIPLSMLALTSMGVLQWMVLRSVVAGAQMWVPVTTLAGLIGAMIPVAALSAVPSDWPLVGSVVVAVLAATAMGATVGFITGRTLAHLAVAEPSRAPARSLPDFIGS